MYLNTRGRYKRRRLVTIRRLAFWIIAPIIIVFGVGVYQNRDAFIPHVTNFLQSSIEQAEMAAATIQAPPPTPTIDPRSILERADLAWSQGLYQDAINAYENIISALPNQDNVHFHYTLGLLMQGRDREAMEAAENAVTANPYSSNVWAIRSLALTRNGNIGEAIASGLRALELQPTNVRARVYLAEAYYEAGQGQRALTEIDRALEQDPNSYEAYYMRGVLTPLITYEGFEQSRDDLEMAYELSNGMIDIGVTLAAEDIYRFDNAENGLALLRELAEKNPENALVLYQLGRYYHRSEGDTNQAGTYLNRCVIAVPNSLDCNYELGRVLYTQGDYAAAAEAFAKPVDLGSTDPYHYWWAGNAQVDLGNCAAATEFLIPGYELAQANQIDQLIADYNSLMGQCGIFNQPTALPELTPEATPES